MINTGLITKGFGGLNFINDGTKTTLIGIAGDYLRIGDAGTTSNSLNSEDDLMVTGELEVDGTSWFDGAMNVDGIIKFDGLVPNNDSVPIDWGGSSDCRSSYEDQDANAKHLSMFVDTSKDAPNNVPIFCWGDETLYRLDLGLFDGVTQPTIAVVEKDAKYAGISNATSSGADVAILTTATASTFDNAVVGDLVRVTAGTNATVGWYWITTATDQYNITLDRNWCTGGAVSGGTIVVYHDFTMLSADGVCTRITDGAPTDSSVEIDRDGWIIVDVGNNALYWRSQSAWKSVLPDGGVKSVVVPFVDGTASTATGWDVDAESEYAYAFGAIPAECNEVISIIIRGRAITTDNTNEMLLDIDISGGSDNEAYNVETYSADDIASDTVPSANNDVVIWTVTDSGVVGSGGLAAGDSFYVSAIGAPTDATDLATDCHFQSVEVKYK